MASVGFEGIFKYYGDVEAVIDVSWTCPAGEVLAIVGPSGCGKSTTLRLIAGLEELHSGRISIGDRLVNRLPPRERRVGFAFETYALFPTLTVFENIAFPLRAKGAPRSEIEPSVREVASIFELEDVLDREPGRLSGGQQQRVGLARALVGRPAVILLDEPISHLDPQHRSRARTFLKEWQQEFGVTMIYVTHDQEEALALADQVLVMNEARLQQLGSPDDVYFRPANLFVASFIGNPPMNLVELDAGSERGSPYLGAAVLLPLVERLPDVDRVVLGVRPQSLRISPQPSGDYPLEGTVYSSQGLGDQAIITVVADTEPLLVLTGPDLDPEIGEPVWLGVDPEEIHLFDAETGRRLDMKGG
jgi:multiple sugar transport system ATP-binding protein